MMRRTASFALTSLACAVVAHAQTTSGALRGTLRSQAGSPIANATVSVRDLANGSVRSTLSDANGNYQLPLLAVGTYQLTVTSAGSQTVQDSNVRIALGLTSVQNYTIASATGASATVEVTGRSQNLDSQQMFTSSSVDQSLIESIPLGGARDFTSLVNLTPGTVYDADSNRVSVEGARGIQNNLSIDGASYNSNFFGEQRGSTRIPFAFGADTIQELQIIRNSYDAQYGNASGAVINAISKSGTNTFSGSLLYQVRPKSLVAQIAPAPYDPTGATSLSSFRTKNFNQVQGNFNFGGPIIKDKLFFFVGTEQYSYTEDFSPTITPTASTGSTLADTVTFLQNFGNMIVGPGTRTLSQDAGLTVDGSGNLVVTNTSKYTNDRLNRVYFGRLDYIINPDHRFTIRVNAQDWSSDNGTIAFTSSSAPRTGVSNQGLEKNSGLSWVAELSSILSPNLVNEARLQRAIERRPRFEKGTSPEFNAFTWTSGQLNYLPNGLDEFSWQFVDNLTYSKDNWTIKAGVDLQSFDFTNTFYRYQNGSFTFFNVGMANKWKTAPTTLTSTDSISYTGAFSDYGGAIAYASKLNSGYGQIQRQGLMDGKLTLNAGLRYVKEIQPNNPRPNAQFMGLDQANSSDALDPRAGFTYDLGGNGKTLVRGGYGHFSSPNPSLTVSNTMNSNGMTTSTYTIANSSTNLALFQTGVLSAAQRLSGNTLSRVTPSLLSSLGTASKTGQVWDPTNEMTKAKRASIGFDHVMDDGLKIGAQLVAVDFINLQYFVNINLSPRTGTINPAGTTGAGTTGIISGGRYNDGYPVGTQLFSFATRPGSAVVRGRTLDFTGFGNVFMTQNGGRGRYHALILTAEKRYSNGAGFLSNITWSQARDNNSNERSTASGSSDSNINNPADPNATFSYSDNDRRFRFVFAGFSPLFWGMKGSLNFSYTSGRPFSAIASADLNGDGSSNDYVLGTTRNGFRQPGQKFLDVRLSKNFTIWKGYDAELFADITNIMNWANFRTGLTGGNPSNTTTGVLFSSTFKNLNLVDRNTRDINLGVRIRF